MIILNEQQSIPLSEYINIESRTLRSDVVQQELIGRLFTTNPLLKTGAVSEAKSANEVKDFFGSQSEEYKRAKFYFEYVTLSLTSPSKLTFARWVDVDVPPRIFGDKVITPISAFNGITAGSFDLIIAGVSTTISGLDFSAVVSYSEIATIIQAAIQTFTGDAQLATATVVFNSLRSSFDFTGGVAGTATITVADSAGGTAIKDLIGWDSSAIFSNGALAQSISEVLDSSTQTSNKFGSYLFMPTLSLAQAQESADWLQLYKPNLFAYYCLPVPFADYQTYADAFNDNYFGVAMTISDTPGEYPEMLPMILTAATDFNRAYVPGYGFIETTLTASITNKAVKEALDDANINYVGLLQSFGGNKSYWQTGVMTFTETTPRNINVYVNENWLKARFLSAYDQLLKNNPQPLTADEKGKSLIRSVAGNIIQDALTNRVITIGRTITEGEKQQIFSVTGNPDTWKQIEAKGYWFDVTIKQESNSKYTALPVLIYMTSEIIIKIDGIDILIGA